MLLSKILLIPCTLVQILQGGLGGQRPTSGSNRPHLFERRGYIFAFSAALLLSACGFEPVHGPGGAGTALQNKIFVAAPDNRNEFDFVAQIEKRLGRTSSAPFTLTYRITTSEKGVGVTPSQETTRYNVFGQVEFEVTQTGTDNVLYSGSVDNFTAYSATALIVGTQSVTRDANQRLMVVLADQVSARLIATAPDWAK